MGTVTDLELDEWIQEYKPIRNPKSEDPGFWGCQFETMGEDLQFLADHEDEYSVWTLVDGEGIHLYIIDGFHYIDRLGYFLTEKTPLAPISVMV